MDSDHRFFFSLSKLDFREYNNYKNIAHAKVLSIPHFTPPFLCLPPLFSPSPTFSESFHVLVHSFNEKLEMTALITACGHSKGPVNDRKEQRAICINQS